MTKTDNKSLAAFINFKLAQKARISGFDYSQPNAKSALKKIMNDNVKGWVSEFIATEK
jgi:hypothetical protein